ncbi:MAG: 50S ribosomal protein L18e [Candidatus Methanomethylophilaceae archaeon]
MSDTCIRALPNVGRVRNMNSKTNPQLVATIDNLKAKTRETDAAIWRDIALRLEKPKKNWAEANLSKIERYAKDGETIIVPGKVLAAGEISKKITVAAYSFSEAAAKAIVAAGGKTLSIEELADANPKGTGVRIMR